MLVATSCLIQILLLAGITEAGSHTSERFFWGFCLADEREEWSYGITNGPIKWGKKFPVCCGKHQTPIALCNKTAVIDENLDQLVLNGYDIPFSSAQIENNGHSVQVTPNPAENEPQRFIEIGGQTFILRNFHFHWGCKPSRGSEHTMNGERYAMELHFVHTNVDGDIAVVGVFFKEGDEPNEELDTIISTFGEIKHKGSKTNLTSPLFLEGLTPENPTSYYRYNGSLTTPGCNENVTWSVLPKVMNVSREQMKAFRTQLHSVDASKGHAFNGCLLCDNYRPLQKLNNRTVFLVQ